MPILTEDDEFYDIISQFTILLYNNSDSKVSEEQFSYQQAKLRISVS